MKVDFYSDFIFGSSWQRKCYKHQKKNEKKIKEDLAEIARSRNSSFDYNITIIEKYNCDDEYDWRIYFFRFDEGYVIVPDYTGGGYEAIRLDGIENHYWIASYEKTLFNGVIKTHIELFNAILEYAEKNLKLNYDDKMYLAKNDN